jgi:hypothetical protein
MDSGDVELVDLRVEERFWLQVYGEEERCSTHAYAKIRYHSTMITSYHSTEVVRWILCSLFFTVTMVSARR